LVLCYQFTNIKSLQSIKPYINIKDFISQRDSETDLTDTVVN